MLALLPILIFALGALAATAIDRLRLSPGYALLAGTLASLSATGVAIFLRWRLPQQVLIDRWLPLTGIIETPILGIDGTSWPFFFILCVTALAVMLTAPVRLSVGVNPLAWAGVMGITATGLAAVLSTNLLTIVLAWTALDIIELIILQVNATERRLGVQTVLAFAARVAGTYLALTAAILARARELPPTFTSLPESAWLLLLLAVGLRLGVLPLNLPYVQEIRLRRGLATALRVSAFASGMVVLARLPAGLLSPDVVRPLMLFTTLAALYTAALWFTSSDELAGRRYWMIASAGLAVASALQEQPRAVLAWGSTLLLSGVMVFLYSARGRVSFILPAAGLLGAVGLPFTPAAGGWSGLFAGQVGFVQLLMLPAHTLLIFGYLRDIFRAGDRLEDLERWVQVSYPLGLSVLILAQWFNGLIGWPGSFTAGVGWAAPASLAIGAVAYGASRLAGRLALRDRVLWRWLRAALSNTGRFLTVVFSLRWLYELLWWLYRQVERAIAFLTGMLEGDGGILWVLVLLALFVSILRAGGVNP